MGRPFWLPLVALLLLFLLGGCSRSIQAMPMPAASPSPGPTLTATPAAVDADASGPALPELRSIFMRRSANSREGISSSRILAKTALRSPLATPLPGPAEQAGESIWAILPTPTPSPAASQLAAVTATTPVSNAVFGAVVITELLDVAVPGSAGETEADTVPGGVSADPLPTPTPPENNAPAFAPAPDGILRTALVPILMYHYLSVPPPDADIYRLDLSVTPELFAGHLDAMRNAGYTAISLYDFYAHLAQGAPLPDKPVVITFDDGYRDNYENALPVLRERGMAATFFVVTDFMDEERPEYLTWDMAREMQSDGMSIESHGRNHVSLQGKPFDYLIWQALGSLETIEYEVGVRPRFVSYPAGEYDQTTADVFASAGYWAGATTVQGATHSSDSLFDLTRVRVRGTTTPDELLRLLELDW